MSRARWVSKAECDDLAGRRMLAASAGSRRRTLCVPVPGMWERPRSLELFKLLKGVSIRGPGGRMDDQVFIASVDYRSYAILITRRSHSSASGPAVGKRPSHCQHELQSDTSSLHSKLSSVHMRRVCSFFLIFSVAKNFAEDGPL